MIGIITAYFYNLIWLGFSFIESIIFMISYNCLIKNLPSEILPGWLPIKLGLWMCFAIFVIIHFIGEFIKKLVPTLINVQVKSDK